VQDPTHTLSLLPMGPFLRTVFDEMDRAERRIFVESYIVKDDRLGQALMQHLLAAAARDVDVRLLYDPSGSSVTPEATWQRLRDGGVKLRAVGPLAGLRRLKPGARDHARLVLIDDAAYLGGHAWADAWLPLDQGGGGWRDLNCRMTGPAVEDWAALFQARWRPRGRPELDTRTTYHDLRLVSDGPGEHDLMMSAHIEAIEAARDRIWIANAYFFPMRRLIRALFRAAERGVDVRIVVPGPGNDLQIMRRANRASYRTWIQRGLKLYESGPPMMHGKYAVIDDWWSTVGSFNMNASAVNMAVESNLIVYQPAFVAQVAEEFESQLALSQRVELADLEHRQFHRRALDVLARGTLLALEGILWLVSTVDCWHTPVAKSAAR
jgi:cardiolipin synthase